MDPEDERSRPPTQESRPATTTTPADRVAWLRRPHGMWMSVRSPEYAAGFAAGWADRAEYERRRRTDADGLDFADGVKVGYELGHAQQQPPTPDPDLRRAT